MTLLPVCREIARHAWTEAQWAERKSDGMFQLSDFGGGFVATKAAFCLDTYVDGVETWLQFSLADALRIAAGEAVPVEATTGRSSHFGI